MIADCFNPPIVVNPRRVFLCNVGIIMDLFVLSTIIAVSMLNRAAGSDIYGLNLPGKPLIYVAPLVACIATIWLPWQTAVAFGVSYYWWRLWPWGRWIYMDRQQIGYGRTEQPNLFEKAIESISFGKARVAMLWRMQFGILPLLALSLFCQSFNKQCQMPIHVVLFAFTLWLSYEMAWRVKPANPIPLAEYAAGALWGFMIISSI